MAKVTELNIYPVKSCKGISLPKAYISKTGFLWDRQWMIVNERNRFITQRQEPKLALIETSLPQEALNPEWGPLSPDAALCLKAPNMPPLYVPLHSQTTSQPSEPNILPVTVWDWSGPAIDMGPDAAEWLTRYLNKTCRLVRFDTENVIRETSPNFASGFQTGFSDGYPFLLISQASLSALNKKMNLDLPMNRFRPNIVVDGCDAFKEDEWNRFKIKNIFNLNFFGVKPCSRCKITTIDQSSLMIGVEPFHTLQTFRSGLDLSIPNNDKNVFFGMNIVCDLDTKLQTESPYISIDDEILIIESISLKQLYLNKFI